MGSPHLSDSDIAKAVKVLDGWQGELTWERYIAILTVELGHHYTKAGLSKKVRIKDAWKEAKKRIASGDEPKRDEHSDPAVQRLTEMIRARDNTINRLEGENTDLLEQFRRWSFNAAQRGISQEQLDTPLPDTAYKRRAGPDDPGRERGGRS